MGSALAIKDEWVDFDAGIMQMPAPVLYIIQFRRNILNPFGSAVPINQPVKGKWEPYGSYETESSMLREFYRLCERPNVISGEYTFRAVWPTGHTQDSKAKICLS